MNKKTILSSSLGIAMTIGASSAMAWGIGGTPGIPSPPPSTTLPTNLYVHAGDDVGTLATCLFAVEAGVEGLAGCLSQLPAPPSVAQAAPGGAPGGQDCGAFATDGTGAAYAEELCRSEASIKGIIKNPGKSKKLVIDASASCDLANGKRVLFTDGQAPDFYAEGSEAYAAIYMRPVVWKEGYGNEGLQWTGEWVRLCGLSTGDAYLYGGPQPEGVFSSVDIGLGVAGSYKWVTNSPISASSDGGNQVVMEYILVSAVEGGALAVGTPGGAGKGTWVLAKSGIDDRTVHITGESITVQEFSAP